MEDAKTVRISKLNEDDPAALYLQYPNRSGPQPCVLALDLNDGELTCRYNPEPGSDNDVPASVWTHRTIWLDMPLLTAAAANQLLDEAAPIAQRILDGATIEWDGNDDVGRLSPAAADAQTELGELIDEYREVGTTAHVEPVDAYEWFSEGDKPDVTAGSTDDDLERVAAEMQKLVEAYSPGGYAIITGLDVYLDGLREQKRDKERERLAEVAERIAELVETRDDMIREQLAWDSSRAVGERAGLSHTHVQRIQKRVVPHTGRANGQE